jgi:hypothetical protein
MADPDYKALCAELIYELTRAANGLSNRAANHTHRAWWAKDSYQAADRARALLAQPEPVAPTRPDCFDLAMHFVGDPEETEVRRYVKALEARPTPQPVAVSERPWERDGWCDEQGRCWWTANKPGPLPPVWWMVSIPQSCTDGIMLPANALPTPEATNG